MIKLVLDKKKLNSLKSKLLDFLTHFTLNVTTSF